jgi:hypothetical protein
MWSRMHMIWHRYAIILAEFLLDPIPTEEIDIFLANHQTMHNDLDAILQVPSQDLTNVDWEDETQRIGWFQAHAQLTQQESNKLGIGA